MKRLVITIAILTIGAILGGLLVAFWSSPARVEAQTSPQASTASLGEGQAPEAKPKPWIGIEIAQREGGVVIVRVFPNSPAEEAGLLVKDIILSIGGTKMETVKDVLERVRASAVGEKLSITIKRGDQELTVEVAVGELKPKELAPRPFPQIAPWFPHPFMWLPPLEELKGILPQEWFQHFIRGEFVYTDKDGNRITVKITPGVVSSVGADSITVKPNGETATVTFAVTDKTLIRKGAKKASLSELKEGEQVVVVTVNDSTRLVLASSGAALKRWPGTPWPKSSPIKGRFNFRPGPGRSEGAPAPQGQRQRLFW